MYYFSFVSWWKQYQQLNFVLISDEWCFQLAFFGSDTILIRASKNIFVIFRMSTGMSGPCLWVDFVTGCTLLCFMFESVGVSEESLRLAMTLFQAYIFNATKLCSGVNQQWSQKSQMMSLWHQIKIKFRRCRELSPGLPDCKASGEPTGHKTMLRLGEQRWTKFMRYLTNVC